MSEGKEFSCDGPNYRIDFEIIDNEVDGVVSGEIVSIIYKGDHYQLIVRTDENEEDFAIEIETKDSDRIVLVRKDKFETNFKDIYK